MESLMDMIPILADNNKGMSFNVHKLWKSKLGIVFG
jgi:hypothetical protein